MVRIERQKDGSIIIDVRVQPKSSCDRIMGEHPATVGLKIAVTSAPEGGKANSAVIKLLSKLLNIPKSNIEIISGAKSRDKRLKISGVGPSQIEKLV